MRHWRSFSCQFVLIVAGILLSAANTASAVTILVDYSYDTNNFFNTQAKRDAMQAAADRYSDIITSSLQGFDANYAGGTRDWRVGFPHPGTGASYQISTASSAGTDAIVGAGGAAANEYDPTFVLPADTWILFAGGRAGLGGADGIGGTGTGTNFTTTFNDPNGPLRRGLGTNLGVNGLPVWGGSIAFDSAATWHFDIATAAPAGAKDFYSIALHEVGHALGLNISAWTDFTEHVSAGVFQGPNAVAAYNADNGTSATGLNLTANLHWQDNTYDSFIFADGNPNLAGTVGLTAPQDLLMEPIADTTATIKRFELTNVDVGALEDIGWSVVPEPSAIWLGLLGALGAIVLVAGRRGGR
jgi:hypothetical protein